MSLMESSRIEEGGSRVGRTVGALLRGAKERFTPAIVQAKLLALAGIMNMHPRQRFHLRDEHPDTGTAFTFDAVLEFVDWDRGAGAHIECRNGWMWVGSGPHRAADTTVRFKERAHMRAFFNGEDTFDMLLDNSLVIEGNLSYLLKFGFMSQWIQRGGKKRSPEPGRRRTPRPARWQDLPAYPRGEPCRERPEGEVEYLDDPHLADRDLDHFPRIKHQLWRYRNAEPTVCSERPRLLTEYVLRAKARHHGNGNGRGNGHGKEPAVLLQARALRHILTHKAPRLSEDDLFAGTTTSQDLGVLLFPELVGTALWPELLTLEAREQNPYRISDEDVEILGRHVFPHWMDDNVREWTRRKNHRPDVLELDERFVLYFMWKNAALSHTVIDLPRALSRGVLDLQEEARQRGATAKDEDRRALYRAMDIALEGVLVYSRRLAQEARERAEQVGKDTPEATARQEELLELARMCERVPAHPAETLHEALQATWILFVAQHQENMNAGLTLGRLDTWLNPYLQRDLAGITDPEARRCAVDRALELVCAFMIKATDHLPMVPDVGSRLFGGSSENQVITLGGLTPDGDSAVCDLTWIFLKATEMLHLRDPNMNARFAPGVNSEAYLRRLSEVNLLTGATPSLHNDNAMVSSLVAQGFPERDARDWTATGCVEPTICGRHLGHTNCMMFNLVAPLEMAFYRGVHPVLQEQVGPRTPDPADCETFDEFFDIFQTQLGWLIDKSVEANNMLGRTHQKIKPTPLLSALFTGPMESGRDVVHGGATFNSSGAAMIGLADVVDSLVAIKTLVFDDGSLDLASLFAALAVDFAGHERLRQRILRRIPKFGQDHPAPPDMARRVMELVYQRYQASPHYRGGQYLPGYWSMSNHVAFGMLSGALPSGRLRGKPFTPGLTPSHLSGAGLTDQIRTVAGLDATRMPNNIAFNVKVVPGSDDSHDDVVERMTAYAGAYFDLGGMQMQFNVVSTETLRQAMAHPEEHRDLLVRISGYNAYFVELNRDIQDEIIDRAEHALSERGAAQPLAHS
ncbi:MAG: pyruvate formate lyase family protein [bacterium]